MNTKTKQTAKHTAGEWRVGGGLVDGYKVYALETGKEVDLTTSANARLIASAPKLLRGLELMTESYEYWMSKYQPEALNSQLVADVKKAIAKAKGE